MGSRHRMSWAGRPNNTRLPGIPEGEPAPRPMPAHVVPGPNAFAQQEARLHSHRLRGNAFYRAEYQRRRLTPPTAIHPAFRKDFSLEDSVSLEESMARTSAGAGVRDSDLTTMSPFIQSPPGQTPPTPPMLVPDHSKQAFPTDRGFIEDRREKLKHEHAGTQTERTPVFVYSPKVDSSEFSKSTSHVTPKKKKTAGFLDSTITAEQTKTPKKGFFERLKFLTPRPSNVTAPITSSNTSRGYNVGGETLPPKAKAVLASPPHNTNLERTPSKRKGLFFRKVSDQLSLGASTLLANEPRSAGALTVNFSDSTGKTPQTMQTAFTDPTHNRNGQPKRAVSSQTQSEMAKENQPKPDKGKNACGVSRTQSLQYFDRTVPPTPPAKNTPPHEKELKLQQEALRKIEDRRKASEERQRKSRSTMMTPKKEMEQTPSSRLRSPIRKAIFDDDTPTRDNARLMGVDGRLSPTKTGTYANKDQPTLVKQPSLYSMHGSVFPDLQHERSFEEIKKCTDGLGLEGLSSLPESFYYREPSITYSPSMYSDDFGARPFFSSPNPQYVWQNSPVPLPPILEQQRQADEAVLSPKRSDLSEATIPCVYPELASDPSRSDLRNDFYNNRKAASTTQVPLQCETPIRHQGRELAHGSSGSNLIDLTEDALLSSPSYTCPSAMPSPLQFLPSTTYSPPCDDKKADSAQNSPSSPSSVRTLTHSSSRRRIEHYKSATSLMTSGPVSPFDNLPFLSPNIRPTFIKSVSPSPTITDSEPEPMKQSHGASPALTIVEDSVEQRQDRGVSPISNIAEDTHGQRQDRGVSPMSNISKKASVQQAQEPSVPQKFAPGDDLQERMNILLRMMQKQDNTINDLRAELAEMHARHDHLAKPRTVSDSSDGDSNAPNVGGSTTNISTIDFSEKPRASEITTSYVPQGSLAQMALHHRVSQHRVDQEFSAQDEADLARHDQSELRRNNSANNVLADAIGVIDALVEKVKTLEEGSWTKLEHC